MYMYEVIGIDNYDKAKNYKDNSHEWIVLHPSWNLDMLHWDNEKNGTLYINCNLSRVFWKYFSESSKMQVRQGIWFYEIHMYLL